MQKKLLLLATKDSYVLSHRYDLAKYFKTLGYEVCIACSYEKKNLKRFEKDGFITSPISFDRSGINPFKELKTLYEIYKLYKNGKPDVVYQVALKPVFYGSFCARLLKISKIINTFGGVGYAFTANSFKANLIKRLVWLLFKLSYRKTDWDLIVQNQEDKDLWNTYIPESKIHVIQGVGINLQKHQSLPLPPSTEPFTFTLVARMLWTKGIGEFINAAKSIKKTYPLTRFLLVGGLDPNNPAHIPLTVLEKWQEEEVVQWLGHQDNLKEIYEKTHVAVLPSYREGVPKSLLEAMSYERAVITTNTPGCKECVKDNGFLVKPYDTLELIDAMKKFFKNPDLIESMGKQSRHLILEKFDQDIIFPMIKKFL
ncbi:MAG TPA: glycosyltransferase family 4 protein [Alphaproteobacteria bacterium]|nr:glycosyltransferase family 4 protein [Alphaproteobacteria bacterium]